MTGKLLVFLAMATMASQNGLLSGQSQILTEKEKKCDINTQFFSIISGISNTGSLPKFYIDSCEWGKDAQGILSNKIRNFGPSPEKNDFCQRFNASPFLQTYFQGRGVDLKCGRANSGQATPVKKKSSQTKKSDESPSGTSKKAPVSSPFPQQRGVSAGSKEFPPQATTSRGRG